MTLNNKYLLFFSGSFFAFLLLQLISFSILSQKIFVYKNEKIIPALMILALFIFIIFSFFEIKKEAGHPLIISLGLILGGGLSNFFDYLRVGGVIDYLNFYFFKANLADIFIFLGLIIFFCLKLSYVKKS